MKNFGTIDSANSIDYGFIRGRLILLKLSTTLDNNSVIILR